METKYIKGPFAIGDVTLFVLERAWFQITKGRSGLWLNGSKQVYAIIICDVNGQRAVAIDATELELTAVIKQMPELDELLNQQ